MAAPALLVAALLLIGADHPTPARLLAVAAVVVLLIGSLHWRVERLAILGLLGVGIVLRFQPIPIGSDVLATTHAAVALTLGGGNPYGHGFTESSPPGAPFPYGPLALVWYAVLPANIEFIASLAVLLILTLGRRLVGLAIYATLAPLAVLARDGSNDTSAGLILLIVLLLAERRPVLGAFALGLAAGFKPYALAWALPLVAYGGISTLAPVAVALAATWGIATLRWGGESILWSLERAASMHPSSSYSLAWALGRSPAEWPPWLGYAVGAALAGASPRFVRSAGGFVAFGAAIFLATLYLGAWSTVAYLAALAPIVCWHADEALRKVGHQSDTASGEASQPAVRLLHSPETGPAGVAP